MPSKSFDWRQWINLRTVAAAAGVFLIGIACGWLAGDLSGSSTSPDAPAPLASALTGAHSVRSAVGADESGDIFAERLAAALSHISRSKRERAIAAIADNLNSAQLRDALAQLDKSRLANREQIRAHLLTRWGELDPSAASAYALALPNARQRAAAVEAVISGWVEHNAQAATKWVAALPDGVTKRDAQEAVITAVAASDPEAALAIVQNTPASLLSTIKTRYWKWDGIVDSIFEQWAQKDPRKAAQAAAEVDVSMRKRALSKVAEQWAEADLAGALAWARSQPSDLGERRLSEGTHEENALIGVLQTWLRKDAKAATKWLEELPDGNEKANLVQSTFQLNSYSDPIHCIELVRLIPEGDYQKQALRTAIRTWTGFDPAGAISWAAEQSEGPLRQNALKVASAQWLQSDFKSASEWITSIPAGAEKDGLLSDAVRVIIKGEQIGRAGWMPSIDRMPGNAYGAMAHLIGAIGDTHKREAAHEMLAEAWLRKDREAARAWLEQSDLSPSVKARLLK